MKLEFEEAFRISETLTSVLKDTKPKDMRLYEMKSLFMLNKIETNNLKEIKELIHDKFAGHIPKPVLEVKIAKTLKTLMEKGLVTKEKCPEDKRQALIKITPKGKKVMNEAYVNAKAKWEEVWNG